MADNTKIDWADATWNPVTGCYHQCPYCYAEKIARRFGGHEDIGEVAEKLKREKKFIVDLEAPIFKDNAGVNERISSRIPYPYDFAPTLHRYMLNKPQDWKRPRTIFVCSMADLFGEWVPDEWIQEVFKACRAAPQHRYLFLTKNPQRYLSLAKAGNLPKQDNFWYGSTLNKAGIDYFYSNRHNTFVSIEPIFSDFDENANGLEFNWAIIGAETGSRKEKVIPEKAWIDHVCTACDKKKIPVFMKSSIRDLMGNDFRQEFPWDDGSQDQETEK